MKDQFLRHFYQEPPPELADRLGRRLMTLRAGIAEEPVPASAVARRRRLAYTLAALLFFLLATFSSPAVRAYVADVVLEIGGLRLRATSDYPGKPGGPDLITPNEILTLENASAAATFSFRLPADVPAGYTLKHDDVTVASDGALFIRWTRPDGRLGFTLFVQLYQPDVQYVVGSESVETVLLGDVEASFIRGYWDADSRRWQTDNGMREIRWHLDGVTYQLGTWGVHLTDEDLIAIAASVAEGPLSKPEGTN